MNEPKPAAPPLYELLRAVPKEERLTIDTGYSTHCIPVGKHCHDAANYIISLQSELAILIGFLSARADPELERRIIQNAKDLIFSSSQS